MNIKHSLIVALIFFGIAADAKPLDKPIAPSADKPIALKTQSSWNNDSEPHSEQQLQRLQGDWLCRDTFHFENDEIKIDVATFGYDHIQDNIWHGQRIDDITISLLVDKQWVTGEAQVIERGKSVIQKVTDTLIYGQLTDLDDEEWISYDDNITGQYIREVFFTESDQLTRKLIKNQTPRRYQIEQLDENTLQYTTVDFSPATYTSCYRIKLTP